MRSCPSTFTNSAYIQPCRPQRVYGGSDSWVVVEIYQDTGYIARSSILPSKEEATEFYYKLLNTYNIGE